MVLYPNNILVQNFLTITNKRPDLFHVTIPQNWKEQRELTQKQFEFIFQHGFFKKEMYKNPKDFFALSEAIHYINPSLAIKLGVNIVLYGGALYFLGNSYHSSFLDELLCGKSFGCFAMTEIGHGSNLKDITTFAKKDGDFLVIHTPDENGTKVWIGGGTVADYTIVFAQLENHGVHAILVPIKNNPSVIIKDMGAKLGLNGVDNVTIRFNQTRVPIKNLLDRYGGYKDDVYTSLIKNPDVRFGKTLSALSLGRISVALGSYCISYKAFQIALKYNQTRRQFKMEKEEKRIIEYPTQLEKFGKIMETLECLKNGIVKMIDIYEKEGVSKRLHALSSLYKVYASWKAIEFTGWCREMCGGHGYLWANEIGLLMNDVNIYQTFEGDNSVLLQQGVKWILEETIKNKQVKIYDTLSLKILKLGINMTNSKNKMQCWNDNLLLVKDIAIKYTEKTLGIKNINYKYHNIQQITLEKLEKQRKIWENNFKTRTEHIPITHYPNYLNKL